MGKVRELLYGDYDPYKQIEELPVRMPFDEHGWNSTDPAFAKYIKEIKPSLIVEVGSWMGASARHMAELACQENIDVEVVCIDTWLGSVEHWHSTHIRSILNLGRPQLFPKFMCNVIHKNLQKYITPFPIDSVNGAHVLQRHHVQADLIYIDAGHEYESVSRDVQLYKEILRVGGVMILDDSHYPPIRRAADEYLPGNVTEGAKIVWTK